MPAPSSGGGLGLWRRDSFDHPGHEAELAWARPLRGVGRVPLQAGTRIAVIAYSEPTRTYEWSCFEADGQLVWRTPVPAGGYARSFYDANNDVLIGPTGYNSLVGVDLASGTIRWTLAFSGALRSSPTMTGTGYLIAVGNRLVRFGDGRTLTEREMPGHLFFGATVMHDGCAFTTAAVDGRHQGHNAIVAFDPQTLEVRWEVSIGPDYLTSYDTCGLAVSAELGALVVNSADSSVLAIDAATGERRWRTALPSLTGPVTNWLCAPAIASDQVLVGTIEGDVYSLRAQDGAVAWAQHLDDLGLWSPPLLDGETAIIHGGLHLYGVSLANGQRRWATPVGFGSYSMPIRAFGRVVVCGGDPPLDGYLTAIDPTRIVKMPVQATTAYRRGETTDGLEIEVRAAAEMTDPRLDLRAFGRSSDERLIPRRGRGWFWSGEVSAEKRLGETVIFGSATIAGRRCDVALRVDAGSDVQPSAAAARTLEDHELPRTQRDRVSSGPAVLAALARSHGRELDEAQLSDAGRFMVERRGIPPVHKWRGGAGRMFMASRFPLPEDVGEEPSGHDLDDALDRWETAE